MKKILAAAVFCAVVAALSAQENVYLWPKKTGPGSEKVKVEQQTIERSKLPDHQNRAITGITQPFFTVFKPAAPNGRGILLCPGGAYQRIVIDFEGLDIVKGYTDAGYTVFILNYRLPSDGHKNASTVPLADAQRAIRLIKENAESYGVLPFRIGVMGFSAGGHVAASLATRYDEETYKKVDKADEQSAKPAFSILIYPVITMTDPYTHAGSRKALLGEKPTQEEIDAASCEKHVTASTPMTFIVCAEDDTSVKPVGNAFAFYQACMDARVKAELHVFPESGHGFGIVNAEGTCKQWQQYSINWLQTYQK